MYQVSTREDVGYELCMLYTWYGPIFFKRGIVFIYYMYTYNHYQIMIVNFFIIYPDNDCSDYHRYH